MSQQACKIVTLSIPGDLALPRSINAGNIGSNCPESLRQAGFWFPGFSPSSLHLSHHPFLQGRRYTHDFRQLIWSRFGGQNGICFRNIFAVTFHLSQELYGIEFRYKEDCIPDSCCSLGRHKSPGRPRARYGDYDFESDKPRGELIAQIEIAFITLDANEDGVGYKTNVRDLKVCFQRQINAIGFGTIG